jgi:hypothetical protein
MLTTRPPMSAPGVLMPHAPSSGTRTSDADPTSRPAAVRPLPGGSARGALMDYDVIVVGGSLAGAALAKVLAQDATPRRTTSTGFGHGGDRRRAQPPTKPGGSSASTTTLPLGRTRPIRDRSSRAVANRRDATTGSNRMRRDQSKGENDRWQARRDEAQALSRHGQHQLADREYRSALRPAEVALGPLHLAF